MKSILVALLVSISAAAGAASLEESYFAARDGYIEKFEPADGDDERVRKEEGLARADLENQLRRIIGTSEIKGFSAPGESNLITLFKGYPGFGRLDGLLYSSADHKTHIVVTTDALLTHWLREHKDWSGPAGANVPQDVDAALRSEAFYTQALAFDADISKYAELPIARPAQAKFAFAMLAARSEGNVPEMPDGLIVSVAKDGRLFVVTAPVNAQVDPMPACQRISRDASRNVAKAHEAHVASGRKDEELFEQSARIEREGFAALRRCFAEQAKDRRFVAALTRQAQELIDRLPAK